MSKLDNLVQELAVARDGLARAKAELARMKQELEATEEWQKWAAAKNTLLPLETEADMALRNYAVILGKGQHHDAVTVQEWTVLYYDKLKALLWCFANLPEERLLEAIELNTKWFEAHAKGVQKTAPLLFVKFGKELNAKISKNLSTYLPEDVND